MKLLDLKASPILRFLTQRKQQKEEIRAEQDKTLAAVRVLCGTEEWLLYKAMLDLYVSNSVKGMLSTNEDSHLHYLRGYVTGLLHAAQIPENLIQQEENARTRSLRGESAVASKSAIAKSSLFATPGWSA